MGDGEEAAAERAALPPPPPSADPPGRPDRAANPVTSPCPALTASFIGTRSTGSAPMSDAVRTCTPVAARTTCSPAAAGVATGGFQSPVAAGAAALRGASATSSIDPAALTGHSHRASQPAPHTDVAARISADPNASALG